MPGLGWMVLLCASHRAGFLAVFVLLSASDVLCGSQAIRKQAQRSPVTVSGQDGFSQWDRAGSKARPVSLPPCFFCCNSPL